MKALLVNPPTGRYMRSDRCQAPVDTRVAEPPRPPMDLAYMAAVLENINIKCKIKDYPMYKQGWQEVIADLKDFKPEMLIVSTTTPTIYNDLKVCDIAKSINSKIRVIAKGAHFLLFDNKILKKFENLDIVIRGEPEITIEELGKNLSYHEILGITFRKGTEIVRNTDRPFWEKLDDLPLPARHLLDNNLYRAPDTDEPIAFIITSRGCPNSCIFCAVNIVSGCKVRMRAVESVIDEIEECIEEYDIRNFFFSADTFTYNKQWVVDLCKEIIKRELKIRWSTNSRVDTIDEERIVWMEKAGCNIIGFGAESASQQMLNRMKKAINASQIEEAVNLCSKYRIESFLIFIIGLPWETKDTVSETIGFVKKTQASFIEVNIAYPIPGTEFYYIGKDNGLFDEESLFDHNYSTPLVKSFSLSTDELIESRKRILRAFYLRPKYIAGRMNKFKSMKSALNYFKYGIKLIDNLLRT